MIQTPIPYTGYKAQLQLLAPSSSSLLLQIQGGNTDGSSNCFSATCMGDRDCALALGFGPSTYGVKHWMESPPPHSLTEVKTCTLGPDIYLAQWLSCYMGCVTGFRSQLPFNSSFLPMTGGSESSSSRVLDIHVGDEIEILLPGSAWTDSNYSRHLGE